MRGNMDKRQEAYDDLEYREKHYEHVNMVRDQLAIAMNILKARGDRHDNSKLVSPEYEEFLHMMIDFRENPADYGTPEARAIVSKYKEVGLKTHYKNNDHHPEHYENGIADMSAFAIIEMLADWWAAGHRSGGVDMMRSITIARERWNL